MALQCQQDAEGCWYYHRAVVPCLLAMAVQAATQGKRAARARGSGGGALGSPVLQRVLLPPSNGKRRHCGPLAGGRAAVPHGQRGSRGCACLWAVPVGSILSTYCLQRAATHW